MAMKRILRYLHGTSSLGLWYPNSENFEVIGFCDGDYTRDKVDRRSTSGFCYFLRDSLVSWTSKKYNTVALSIAEAEYMSASSYYSQLLWMKHQMVDYNISFLDIPLYCNNVSAINVTKNLVLHYKTKHIEIRHHFIHEHV